MTFPLLVSAAWAAVLLGCRAHVVLTERRRVREATARWRRRIDA